MSNGRTGTKAPPQVRRDEQALRAIALAYPEAHEDFPWGERALKVKGKVFLFLYAGENGLSLSTKLPASCESALMLPFAEPTGYGLGKSGWVSARFGVDDDVPIELLRAWIDESYRAVAPKTLVRTLGGGASNAPEEKPAPKKPAAKKNAAKKNAAKKAAANKRAASATARAR
jgi:predicted DNA-binding protein (MmcQ/YjbR family)